MPFFSYHCSGCDAVFETLVRGDETPTCPHCGGTALERQMSAAALHGKTNEMRTRARAQAAREGHLSNFSAAELRRK